MQKRKGEMKKLAFFGIMTSVSIMTGAALADSAVLTTQGYVDKGLRTVYQKIDAEKANKNDVYTKQEIEAKGYLTTADVENKANAADVYTKQEIEAKGYLTDADIDAKANAADVYTKQEIEAKGYLTNADIDAKANAADVYTKDEIDNAGFITSGDVEDGKKYVYTSNGWDAITVEDTFDPDFDFGG